MELKPRYAVFGHPIAHSLSPVIHQCFARQCGISLQYDKVDIDPNHFEEQVFAFFQTGGKGLNITAPFKQRAFAMADVSYPQARLAKAGNTLWYDSGQLYIENTDGMGLVRDLSKYISLNGQSILLLGAGGAARSVYPALLNAHPKALTIATRTPTTPFHHQSKQVTYCTLNELTPGFNIIINATPITLTQLPIPLNILSTATLCYDLNYNHQNPPQSIPNGPIILDGLGMLIEQAAISFSIWHERNCST